MLPGGIESGRPVPQVAQLPGPVCQGCHHVPVSLSHLQDQGEKAVIHPKAQLHSVQFLKLDTKSWCVFTTLPESFCPSPPDPFVPLLERCS